MSRKFFLMGLAPENVTLRLRQRIAGLDRPWTEAISLSPGHYAPLPAPDSLAEGFPAHVASYLTVADGGTGAAVPDLDAIAVTVSTSVIPRKRGVSLQLVSSDPNFHAFVTFGTARWTFSQNSGEDYTFQSLSGRLSGETAGAATGPYVGHVYLTGPGQGVGGHTDHQWSVTLSYPGLPDRIITWEDGATDRLTGLPCGAIRVVDDDAHYAGRTKYWCPQFADAATARAALDAMDQIGTAIPGWSGLSNAQKEALLNTSTTWATAKNSIPGGAVGGRLMCMAGDSYTGAVTADRIGMAGMRVETFYPDSTETAPFLFDFSGLTEWTDFAVGCGDDMDVIDVKVLGPFDPVTPGTAPALQYGTNGFHSTAFPGPSRMSYFRVDVSGFAMNFFFASAPCRYAVYADVHSYDWYNYGGWTQSLDDGAMVGCRFAQNANALHVGRILRDRGGGNANQSIAPQQAFRDAFDWADLNGRITIRDSNPFGDTPASIPEDYQIYEADGVTPKIAFTADNTSAGNNRSWGKHPYDVANGGTAAWDWIVRHHSALSMAGFPTLSFHGQAGQTIWDNAFNDSYEKCAIHGPIRFAACSTRMGMHQCEFRSSNGWSDWDFSRATPNAVTGRYDIEQTEARAYAVQPCLRIWTDAAQPSHMPPGNEKGLSIWRIVCEGGGITTDFQTGGSIPNAYDKTLPHSGIVIDGVIVDNEPESGTMGIRIGLGRTAVRNSLVIRRDADVNQRPLSMIVPGSLSRAFDDEGTPQAPMFTYFNTVIWAGTRTTTTAFNFIGSGGGDWPGSASQNEDDGPRRVNHEWGNVRLMAGTALTPADGFGSYTSLTAITPTQGTESFAYAPTADSNMLAAAPVAMQPVFDLEGAVRPAKAAIGAFEPIA
jgi:hypothetical protein